MNAILSQLFPIIYGACFLVLLWQAFRVMGQGFRAVPRPGDPQGAVGPVGETPEVADRTGRVTIHPELLDADGQLTSEDLLTVRFSGDNERPAFPGDPS
ncbi:MULTISPECIES: DUF2973 domain-containing protein [Aphanothece]|uniref:DUF2973 domain-containing protein n=1 Tax=Aphanothece TaxID=1121 RepID=UPI0039846523